MLSFNFCPYTSDVVGTIFSGRDDTAARTLPTSIATIGAVTAESCTAACQEQGYLLAGMEYSQECCKYLTHPSYWY